MSGTTKQTQKKPNKPTPPPYQTRQERAKTPIDKILDDVEATTPKLKTASLFAKKLYKDFTRLSGENAYEHALRVTRKLIDSNITDENVLVASLLHLAFETPNINKKELTSQLKEAFGEDILQIIQIYNELHSIKVAHEGTQGLNEKLIIQTYMNLAKDIRVLLIRLADRADNIETAYALPRELGIQVAQRSLYVYSPIARLLQLNTITKELENGGFKILYPSRFYEIEQEIKEKLPHLEEFLNKNIPVIKEILLESGINCEITYRIKHIYSIHKKSQKYISSGLATSKNLSEIYDISAMRIIVDTTELCYKTEDILNKLWERQDKLRDDYILSPKPSGYQSLHNVYKTEDGSFVEIQVRTHEMNELNKFGKASHLAYKLGDKFKKNMQENPNFLKDVSGWSKELETNEGITKIKHFENKVYVFTPKGDIIEIPNGGCIVDFAYGVHTKIGNSCVGGLVNGVIQKLNYVLKTGDVVEIKTSLSKRKPNHDWLKFVKSDKAKVHIRKELRID